MTPDMCNNATNVFCWMQCTGFPGSAAEEEAKGLELYCADTSKLSAGDSLSTAVGSCGGGNVMNQNCKPTWYAPEAGVPFIDLVAPEPDPPFCVGATAMYMNGFIWPTDVDARNSCLVLWFSSWVLDSAGLYAAGTAGVFLLAVVLEFLIYARRLAERALKEGQERPGAKQAYCNGVVSRPFLIDVVKCLFYLLQLGVGYFLMLAVMTCA